jgi:hypothetical protein
MGHGVGFFGGWHTAQKVAAGFIPAQYHSRFQLQMAGNTHPLPSGGGFTTCSEKKSILPESSD